MHAPGRRRVLLDTLYALSAFPLAVTSFILVVATFTLGLSLAVLVVGVLITSYGVLIARAFAHLERDRLHSMQARPLVAPTYLRAPPGDGWLRRMLLPLRDRQSWLDVAWAVSGVLTGAAALTVTLIWWAAAGSGLTYWIWQRFIPDGTDTTSLASAVGLADGSVTESLLNLLVGVFALLTLPTAVRLSAQIHARLARTLLTNDTRSRTVLSQTSSGPHLASVPGAE